MAEAFWTEIVAADRRVWEGEAISVVARTTEGDIGLLAHHEPLIAPLVPSTAEVTTPDGRREVVVVDGGFLSVTPTRVALISPFAQLAHEISLEEAEHELREAQKAMDAGDNSEEVNRHYLRARAQIRAVHLVA
ncbi:MAG TPA: F0F1 ATP synthase subunit epsilon [Propionibacteriaceae bacterium]|nr:F0F1 ATP synthase subunit epsilon [Propionibacteriaceae bacterium]